MFVPLSTGSGWLNCRKYYRRLLQKAARVTETNPRLKRWWRQKAAFSCLACCNRITYYLSIWRWGHEPWTPFWRGLQRSLCLWEPAGRPHLWKDNSQNVNIKKTPVSIEETCTVSTVCISTLSQWHFTFCLPHSLRTCDSHLTLVCIEQHCICAVMCMCVTAYANICFPLCSMYICPCV